MRPTYLARGHFFFNRSSPLYRQVARPGPFSLLLDDFFSAVLPRRFSRSDIFPAKKLFSLPDARSRFVSTAASLHLPSLPLVLAPLFLFRATPCPENVSPSLFPMISGPVSHFRTPPREAVSPRVWSLTPLLSPRTGVAGRRR